MEYKELSIFPITIHQLNKILDKLVENEEYIAKIGDIEIGLCKKDKKHQTFFISRDIKESE